MSGKGSGKPKYKTVTKAKAKSVENSESLENTIKPSEEFLQVFQSAHTFHDDPSKFSQKQMKQMEMKVKLLFHKLIVSEDPKFDDTIILANTYVNICSGYIQLVNDREKLLAAKDLIMYCLHLIKDKEMNSKCILIALKSYYNLGHIYYMLMKAEKAVETYDKGVQLYLRYMTEKDDRLVNESEDSGHTGEKKKTEKDECNDPIDCENLITNESLMSDSYKKLLNVYATILELVVALQTHLMPTDRQSLLKYKHLLLKVEDKKLPQTKAYFKFIESSLALCDCFLMYNRFREAINHLAVAQHVKVLLQTEYTNISGRKTYKVQKSSKEELDLNTQNYTAYKLIVFFMIKYGIVRLQKSAERLLSLGKGREDCEANNLESNLQELLLFANFESCFPAWEPLSIEYISDYNRAKRIFICIVQMLRYVGRQPANYEDMQMYKIILYTFNAYKYIALYEKDTSAYILLQNQRIKMLSSAIILIPSKHQNVLRYLRFQLALVYSTLIDIEVQNLEAVDLLFASQRYNKINGKINDLIAKGLQNLQM